MKVNSGVKQSRFSIEHIPDKDNMVLVRLRNNYKEVTIGEQTMWEYDEYSIELPNTIDNAWIEQYFDNILNEAKEKEETIEANKPENILKLKQRNVELEEQNAMLVECILEMSEIIYE